MFIATGAIATVVHGEVPSARKAMKELGYTRKQQPMALLTEGVPLLSWMGLDTTTSEISDTVH